MHKRLLTYSVLLSLVWLIVGGCKKAITPAPSPATYPSFAATVNGIRDSNWVVTTSGGKGNIGGYTDVTFVNIDASSANSTSDNISLCIYYFTGVGTYPLNSPPLQAPYSSGVFNTGVSSSVVEYVTNTNHPGSVTFTKVDILHNLVSGTFSFTAIQNNTGPGIVNITNGSFSNLPLH
jgi:hypothetical protein